MKRELTAFARNDYSQFGEDGVLESIFQRIGTSNKWCLECGAADGLFFSNTRRLIELGWTGVLVEADAARCARLTKNSEPYSTHCFNVKIGPEHRLDDILASAGAPSDIDLAVIDVDGQDFHVFNAMLRHKPRVVVIEYCQGDPEFIPTLGGEGQAGLRAITALCAGRDYVSVWRSYSNLICVIQELKNGL